MSRFKEQGRKEQDAFVSWDGPESQKLAFAEMGRGLDKIEPIYHSKGAIADQFRNIDTNTSVRSGFSRQDYEYFRPAEQIPKHQRAIVGTCMAAYKKVSLVRQTIDLMADFACQGIKVSHRDKATEQFYKAWAAQVDLSGRSERFLNMFYRAGNVVIKRSTAILNDDMVKDFRKTTADYIQPTSILGPDMYVPVQNPDSELPKNYEPKKREIPWRYTIHSPLTLNVIGEEMAAWIGDPVYSVQINQKLTTIINNPRNQIEKSLVKKIPDHIISGVKAGLKSIPLDPDHIITMYYKKDDWEVWATPMIYSILDDLILLEKLKLADLTALDGAIQHIRVWKLGDLEHKILPTQAAISKFADVLLNNVGGGCMDFIWGPDIELLETSTDIQKFLGSEKYGPTLTSICAGLGIPMSMGGASDDSSYTNNFLSTKTLMERLTYGRNMLTAMWKKELDIVKKAMGFRYSAEVSYDNMSLSDDASMKALWFQLYDRHLASKEAVQEQFGLDPDIEKLRVSRDAEDENNGVTPPKAGPFVDSQPKHSLQKIALQKGLIGPNDVGVEGSPVPIPGQGPKGRPQQGRPLNSKDKSARKKRTTTPMSPSSKGADDFIDLTLWATAAQKDISDFINPIMLAKYGKKNLRSLTVAEDKEIERFKFMVLSNIEPFAALDKECLTRVLSSDILVYNHIDTMKDEFVKRFISTKGVAPTVDELKQIQAFTYAVCKGDF